MGEKEEERRRGVGGEGKEDCGGRWEALQQAHKLRREEMTVAAAFSVNSRHTLPRTRVQANVRRACYGSVGP